jgi:hypothetical protein
MLARRRSARPLDSTSRIRERCVNVGFLFCGELILWKTPLSPPLEPGNPYPGIGLQLDSGTTIVPVTVPLGKTTRTGCCPEASNKIG